MIFPLGLAATLLVSSADSAQLARLDSAIAIEARAGYSGVVLISEKGNVVFERAYGKAARDRVPPADLAFWLASDSKQFTATAIVALAERGRLKVSDSISRYFPNAPADKRAITIDQLLTHTSGLPHEYAADGILDRDQAARAILSLKLKSPPGARYSYSNDGYTLLAMIVEIASGVPFDSFIVDSLFSRASLTKSGVWGHERSDVRIASSPDPKQLARARPTIFRDSHSVANWGYRGPTGAFATANDVNAWVQALLAGKILTDSGFHELVGRHVQLRSDSTGASYVAYGWGTRVEHGADTWYSHVGNEDWLGHNCVIRFTPAGDAVVVLSNSGDVNDEGWAVRVNRVVRKIMDSGK